MATSALINSQHAAASISLANAHPSVTAADSSSGSSSDSGSTISANDFLTLLVTEMQNQDPTADTDPNEYINQLVNVNSLEQLIQINQTLSSAVPVPTSGSVGTSTLVHSINNQSDAHAPAGPSTPPTPSSQLHPAAQSLAIPSTPAPSGAPVVSGNLTVPAATPAALRVAGALGAARPRR